jgi:hypothetical protein
LLLTISKFLGEEERHSEGKKNQKDERFNHKKELASSSNS